MNDLLKENTKTLGKLLEANLKLTERFEIILQIYKNMEILRKEDLDPELKELDNRVTRIFNNLTSKSFVDKLLEKISSI